MSINLSMRDATPADLPTMIALSVSAMEPDLLNSFLWSPRRHEAIAKETASLTTSLGRRFTHPTNRCHIHVVTDSTTDEILGWTLIRWEDGSWPLTPPSSSARATVAGSGEGEGEPFAVVYGRAVKQNWARLVGGRPHIVLGALHVRPDRQRQGVGRYMVDWLYQQYNLTTETVIVQTRAMSEEFYVKLGWTTVDVTEIDLARWGGVGRGYGVHRSPQMIRGPMPTAINE